MQIMLGCDDLNDSYFNDPWDLSMSTVPDAVDDRSKSTLNARSPTINRVNFDFFGLSTHVKNLIFKYKGIDKLYGNDFLQVSRT